MSSDPEPKVIIRESNPAWPQEFDSLCAHYRLLLGEVEIEHIGSTAVPGLAAKPILDMVILFDHDSEAERIRATLAGAGFPSQGEKGVPGREAFAISSESARQGGTRLLPEHHLYLSHRDGEFMRVQRLFRDYLAEHPEIAKRYGMLKRSLAEVFAHDRVAYTDAKGPFVLSVLAAATQRNPEPFHQAASADLDDFVAIDLRVGTVVTARPLPEARRPAIVMEIDFGPVGLLASSAQVTDHYTSAQLLGRQVTAVVNLPPRQVGSVMSRCLVLGADQPQGVILLGPDAAVPNGARVH